MMELGQYEEDVRCFPAFVGQRPFNALYPARLDAFFYSRMEGETQTEKNKK